MTLTGVSPKPTSTATGRWDRKRLRAHTTKRRIAQWPPDEQATQTNDVSRSDLLSSCSLPALFQKVQNLLEDIFEESDGFSPNPTYDEVNRSRFFSGLNASGEHPLLSPETVDKLVQSFGRLQRSKRSRQAKAEELPWDVDTVSRLLRVLERSMSDGQDLDPFPDNGRRTVIDNTSPTKGGRKKGKKASNEPELSPELEVTDEEKNSGQRILSTMSNAAAAALCCFVVLRTPGLPKQLYSEDLLTMAVSAVRSQMSNVLFPVIEGLAGESTSRPPQLS